MSKNLTALKVIDFDTMVKAEYQSAGFLLNGTTQVRKNVKGKTAEFNLVGRGIAQMKIPQDDVTLMNPAYTKTTATLVNWNAADLTDIFDQQEVLFDEKQVLARTAGMSIGRRKDQIILDIAHNVTLAADHVIAHGSANMTYAKFKKGVQILNRSGVSRRAGKRFCVMSADTEEALLNDDKFINNDYVKNGVLNKGNGLDGEEFLGVTFIVIPDMDEGGIKVTTNIEKIFMWHEFALGFAQGIDFKTEINYLPLKTSWLVNSIFKAGAKEVDIKGIVQINNDITK